MWRIGLLLLLLVPGMAHAEWHRAESRHFIVYSDGSPDDLKKSVVRLEKYDRVLRWAASTNEPDAPIKLTIYLVKTMSALQDTLGGENMGVLGYYTASSRGPMIVGLAYDPAGIKGMDATVVLQHEYAHHFMLHYFPAAYPTWFTEGFAEYYGQTNVRDDDVVEVGHAALARYRAFGQDWLPVQKVLTAQSYEDVGIHIGSLYSEGWLLVHYLTHNPARKGQLQAYLKAINAGKSYQAAMNEVFGPNAAQLDTELHKYSSQRGIPALAVPFKPLEMAPVEVTTVSPAQQALIEKEIQLKRDLRVSEARDFAQSVRAIARRFPDDPYALSILIDAERAVGNDSAAMAAADRWLAKEPAAPRALMHKAELQIAALKAAKSEDDAAWKAARELLVQAVKGAPKDAMVLEAYYDSFTARGVLPPAAAQNALYTAFELVPRADELRYKLARDFEQRGMLADAIATIKPKAFELHGAEDESEREKKRREEMEEKYRAVGVEKHETAREMLVRLEKKFAEQGSATQPPSAN